MIKIKNGPLYQWDLNRTVEIDDEENEISEVHCCCENDANALLLNFSRVGNKVVALIPNVLLQSGKKIYVFAIHNQDDEVRTAQKKAFCVCERNKPADYAYEETEIMNYRSLRKEFGEALAEKADLDAAGKLRENQLPVEYLSKEIARALTSAKESGAFNGDKGDTPVKGVDYFTEEDKAEIVQAVLDSLSGSAVLGYTDENNNITFQGNLADGTYSVRYQSADGTPVEIGSLEISSSPANLLPLSVDESGADFVGTHENGGDGYEYGYRVMRSDGSLLAAENISCSGFMPVTSAERVRISNVTVYKKNISYNVVAFYDSSGSFIDATTLSAMNSCVQVVDEDFLISLDDFAEKERIALFRFSCGGITDESIVTTENV